MAFMTLSVQNIIFILVFSGSVALVSTFQNQSAGIWSGMPLSLPVTERPASVADNNRIVGMGTELHSYFLAASAADTDPEYSSPVDTSRQEYKKAPNFTLETLEGDSFTLSDYEGDVVVLNIWATWCPPCREEIPDFIELQEEMKDDGVRFIGVSVDEEGWEAVRPFSKEYEFNYPLVVDNGIVRQNYGPFRGIPTTFIINKRGQVEYVAPGKVTKQMIKPALEELVSR